MSFILERALAPLLVAVVWIVAIFTMTNGPAGGLDAVLAGLIGGAAMILQACTIGTKGLRRVLGMRPAIAAGSGVLLFLAGVAFAFIAEPWTATHGGIAIGNVDISMAGVASLMVRLGIAVGVVAVVAQAGLSLFDSREDRR